MRRRDLHLGVDRRRPHVESAAEEVREPKYVVDLVGVVASASHHDVASTRHGRRDLLGPHLGVWVRHREDRREVCHRLDVLAREHVCGGNADKDVRPDKRLLERLRLRVDGVARLERI